MGGIHGFTVNSSPRQEEFDGIVLWPIEYTVTPHSYNVISMISILCRY